MTPVEQDESAQKSRLVAAWEKRHPSWPILRHEDVRSCGTPDISLTGNDRTLWVEAKVADARGRFRMRGVQRVTCQKLARVGRCSVLIWSSGGTSWTLANPLDVVPAGPRLCVLRRPWAIACGDTVDDLVWALASMLERP